MRISRIDRLMFGVLTRRALWKWAHRGTVDAVYDRVLRTVDRRKFEELRSRYPSQKGDIGPNKFADLEYWLRESVVRALRLGLHRCGALRIVDIGSGAGYFLLSCRALGHSAVGLDLDGTPIFDEMIALFELPRLIHRVTPELPLTPGDERFDLITAFMITFNEVETEREWGSHEWSEFLRNCVERIAPRGRLFLSFNYSHRRDLFYDEDTARLFDRLPGFRARRSGNEVLLQRVG